MCQWTWECQFLLEILISNILDVYPEVGLQTLSSTRAGCVSDLFTYVCLAHDRWPRSLCWVNECWMPWNLRTSERRRTKALRVSGIWLSQQACFQPARSASQFLGSPVEIISSALQWGGCSAKAPFSEMSVLANKVKSGFLCFTSKMVSQTEECMSLRKRTRLPLWSCL